MHIFDSVTADLVIKICKTHVTHYVTVHAFLRKYVHQIEGPDPLHAGIIAGNSCGSVPICRLQQYPCLGNLELKLHVVL